MFHLDLALWFTVMILTPVLAAATSGKRELAPARDERASLDAPTRRKR